MTAKRTSGDRPYDEPGDGGGNPSAGDLESKQTELQNLQEQEKRLVAEIAGLRTLQADITAFEGQITANSEALDRERLELQTFAGTELKGLDAKTRAAIETVKKEVDASVATAESEWKDSANGLSSATDVLARSATEQAKAEADYNRIKQSASEAKRVLGELKTLKKEAQAAEGRNEFAVAGYWLLEIERRLPELQLPGTDALKAAWDEVGKKRKAAEAARRDADAAKANEAKSRKARDEAKKTRESVILQRLSKPVESQKPETAA